MALMYGSIVRLVRTTCPLVLVAATSVPAGGCSPRPLTPLDKVFSDVSTNEVAALETYKKETIRFKAVVHSTGLRDQREVQAYYMGSAVSARENIRQVPYALLVSGASAGGSVLCHFFRASDVAKLRPGDEVVVDGRVYWVQGRGPAQVMMSRCKLVE